MDNSDVMDVELVTSALKGKGRAEDTHGDKENLPWCVYISQFYSDS